MKYRGPADIDSSSPPEIRALVLTELFLPTKGGTAVWFDEVYRRLGGKEIHILTAHVPGCEDYDRDHPNSVHRLRLVRHRWLRPESAVMYAKLLAHSLALALRHRFYAVHAGRVLPEGLIGLIVARLARIPLVIYAHGEEITTWRQPAKLRAMSYAYRHADLVIANSGFTRTELLKLGVPESRIRVVYPGVDIARFRPGLDVDDIRASLATSNAFKLVLSVGRLSRRKGFDQTIRAIARLRNEGVEVRYAVVGIGEDEAYLRNIATEQGVADRVHFLGLVPEKDLARWYNAADVFAMPNRAVGGDSEGFGMVFLEAGACGKPAVSGIDGGTGDAVIDGVTGYRVDGASEDEIASALRTLLADAELARALGVRGQDRARSEFSWEHVADKTRELCAPMQGRPDRRDRWRMDMG